MKNAFPSYEELVNLVNQILDNAVDPTTGEKETLTLRQIFYKLVVMKAFENIDSNYKLLSARLVKAREAGDVDDSRIEDRARQIIGGDVELRNPEDYYRDHSNTFYTSWKRYSRPFWLDQPNYVECWIEKDTLSRIAADAAGEYNVTVCVGRGYSSYSYVNEAVKRIIRMCGTGEEDGTKVLLRRPVILYYGDFDPSGENMVHDLEDRLRRYGLSIKEDYQIVRKIAITKEQIEELHLPTIPISQKKQKDDSRSKKFISEFGLDTVELDTLDTAQLKDMIRSAIEKNIDSSIWNEHQKSSNWEREELKRKIERHFERTQ